MDNIKNKIREVQDWPKKGINFKDITTLLQDKDTFKKVIDSLADFFVNEKIDKVVGIDARGFLVASPLAYKLNAGLVIVRKPGKLPFSTIQQEYTLEYGKDVLQMHTDAILKGEKVILIDDLIATGGTAMATCNLIEKLGGKVAGVGCIIDLPFLNGSKKLEDKGYKVKSLITYDSE
ncbi:MAG: adenine phosphoribosyltransferase [Candidatus Pacebacteria bacterium]|nr:adenine phosphoribosyltransferase [Candidatus Paceibacterota bacterium]